MHGSREGLMEYQEVSQPTSQLRLSQTPHQRYPIRCPSVLSEKTCKIPFSNRIKPLMQPAFTHRFFGV